jgi:hypothetical protein
MTTKDAIKANLALSRRILEMFVGDLSDADLLVRPCPTANCIAWQWGHVIAVEAGLHALLPGGKPFELPAGFTEAHTKATAQAEPAKAGFRTKAEYMDLFMQVRAATEAGIDKLSDLDFDVPASGPVAAIAPTLGHVLLLTGSHLTMHTGQFSVVRRLLGKPVLF